MADPDLTGRTVGVTADRRGGDQVVMFSRLGARVVAGPTISTVKLPDPELLRSRTRDIVDAPPDYLIADTGTGMRTWMEAAEEWGIAEGLKTALSRSRVAARGPKAAGALTSAGLAAWWRSPNEQLGELVEHLISTGVGGKRVAFQLHGDPGTEYVDRLRSAGAEVVTLPVYVWTAPADPTAAFELIDQCCDGGIDAVTFTAGPQVTSLFELASSRGRSDSLLQALNGSVIVGCIGPVCAAAAEQAGIAAPLVPANWRLGSLVKTVAAALKG